MKNSGKECFSIFFSEKKAHTLSPEESLTGHHFACSDFKFFLMDIVNTGISSLVCISKPSEVI